MCPYLCVWAQRRGEGTTLPAPPLLGLGLFPAHPLLSLSHGTCRTCGSPTLEAATACPARAAALCSGPTRSRSTRPPRPFSCSLQVQCPPLRLGLNGTLSWPFFSLLGLVHTIPCMCSVSLSFCLSPPPCHLLSLLIPTPPSLSLSLPVS